MIEPGGITSAFAANVLAQLASTGGILDDAYRQFLADVAEGRNKSIKDVEQWADGKIYSGRQAKAIQMIDDIGGIKEAVAKLKLLLKTDEDLPVYRVEPDLLDRFFAGISGPGFQLKEYAPDEGRSIHPGLQHNRSRPLGAGMMYMSPLGLSQLPGFYNITMENVVR